MKRIILLVIILIGISDTYSQLPQNARLIAGTQDYSEYRTMDYKNYITEILKPQADSLVTDMNICDSLSYLNRIFYYPYFNTISILVTKKNDTKEYYPENDRKIITLNTITMDTSVIYLPLLKTEDNEEYTNFFYYYLLSFSGNLKYSIYYYGNKKSLNYLIDIKTKNMELNNIVNNKTHKEELNKKPLFPNYIGGGGSICVYCSLIFDYIFFRTDTMDNKLHFYHDLDQGTLFPIPLSESYQKNLIYAYVSVNNPNVMVLNFSYEDGSYICRILNKKTLEWNELKINSSVNYKQNNMYFQNYENWLTGKKNIAYPNEDFDKFIGQKQWNEIETPYSPMLEEIMFEDIGVRYGYAPRYYSDGILYLYNINTKKLIEFDTKQVDSEILNVKNDTLYYRVYDELYSAPIINNEKLGEAKLLIKHDYIPAVHYMFFKGE